MLERIMIGAAGAVVAVLIISALTKFTGWISVLFEPAVPDGAVVAFLSPCKEVDGWEDYADGAGKFLLGAGKGVLRPQGPHRPPQSKSEMPLSEIKFGDQGGQEAHTLTIDEMPGHNHGNGPGQYLVQITGRDTVHASTDSSSNEIDIRRGFAIKVAGGGQPHNNMPPYIALHFCQKKR